MSAPGNRLAAETSPYLLQHADNPVHWQAWDQASLAQARAENRPILLSVGSSACHARHGLALGYFEGTDGAAGMGSARSTGARPARASERSVVRCRPNLAAASVSE